MSMVANTALGDHTPDLPGVEKVDEDQKEAVADAGAQDCTCCIRDGQPWTDVAYGTRCQLKHCAL